MIGEWNVFDCSSPVTASLLSSAVPKITPESDIGLRLSLNFLGA